MAEALKGWLKPVINQLNPWMSEVDMDAGKRWFPELASVLEEAEFGIVCVTPENTSSRWMMFEAGALAKSLKQSLVIPVLAGMSPAELPPPLSQFQAVVLDKAGIWSLVQALRRALSSPKIPQDVLRVAFEGLWPLLHQKLVECRQPRSTTDCTEVRSDRELLEEIVRSIRRLEESTAGLTSSGWLTSELSLEELIKERVRSLEGEISIQERAMGVFETRGQNPPRPLVEYVEGLHDKMSKYLRVLSAVDDEVGNDE